MNTTEFSIGFDSKVNSYNRTANRSDNSDIKFTEWEKSIWLTKAEYDLVRNYYSGRNAYLDTFENSEEIRRALNELVSTATPTRKEYSSSNKDTFEKNNTEKVVMGVENPLTDNSAFYVLPDNVWFIVYEQVKFTSSDSCINGKTALVVPVKYNDVFKQINNPFKGPSKDRVLRLDIAGNLVELVSNYQLGSYIIRYVKKPNPIILTRLTGEMTIEGKNTVSECELNPVVHDAILELAVRQALESKAIGAATQK